MKKTILSIIVCTAVLATPFCKKKTVAPGEAPDSYDDSNVTTIKVEKKQNSSNAASDPYSKQKMKPQNERTFGEKLMGLNKFQDIEPFSIYVKSLVGKMSLKKASLIHRAGTDIGGFFCYYDTSAYAVQFAEQARTLIVSAVNQYLDDFANRRLDKNAKIKKTEAVYGMVEGYEEYGIAKAMMKNYARPKICMGYAFVDGNPYFMLYAKKTKNLGYEKKSDGDTNWENTIVQRYYFTKAQAKKLAEFLSNENISFLQSSTSYTEVEEGDYDDYDGYEEVEPTPVQKETKTVKTGTSSAASPDTTDKTVIKEIPEELKSDEYTSGSSAEENSTENSTDQDESDSE